MSVSRTRVAVKFMLIVGACLMVLCAVLAIAAAQKGGNPPLLLPRLSEDKKAVFSKSGAVVDYGNASQGYVMVRYTKESSKRLKVRITQGQKNMDYDLNRRGEYEVFPLQMGDGKYKVQVFQESQKKGQFAQVASTTITVKLDHPDLPYLYPNQYVSYNAASKAVALSYELCEGLTDDKEKIKAIYAFCTRRIAYHHIRANSAKKGYLPDLDAVLAERKAICFDYAALMACMLRVQGIPAQLVIGYADKTYHAWNNVKVDGKWYRYDPTYAAVGNKAEKYTEERRY